MGKSVDGSSIVIWIVICECENNEKYGWVT